MAIGLSGMDMAQLDTEGCLQASRVCATKFREQCKTYISIAPHGQPAGSAEMSWSCTSTARDEAPQELRGPAAGPASPHALLGTGMAENALFSLQRAMLFLPSVGSNEFLSVAYDLVPYPM